MWYTPRVVYILSQRDPGNDFVHNLFALTVCWEVTLGQKFQIEQLEVSSSHSVRRAINRHSGN